MPCSSPSLIPRSSPSLIPRSSPIAIPFSSIPLLKLHITLTSSLIFSSTGISYSVPITLSFSSAVSSCDKSAPKSLCSSYISLFSGSSLPKPIITILNKSSLPFQLYCPTRSFFVK